MNLQRMTPYLSILRFCNKWFYFGQTRQAWHHFPFRNAARLSAARSFKKWTAITVLVCSLFMAPALHAIAQRGYDWRTKVDLIVQRADSLALKTQKTFYQNRVIRKDRTFKNDQTVRETWYYTISEGKIVIFQIRYLIDSLEYTETYYLNNGSLVCLEQYENVFYSTYDEVNWGKVLFFENNALKLNISVGQRKLQDRGFNSTAEAVEIFNKRYSELLRNLRLMVNG